MAAVSDRPPALRPAPLFDVDPDLAEALDAAELAQAQSRAVVGVVELHAGPWSPDALARVATRPFALLVLDGMLLREQVLIGDTATELLGPTDIVALGGDDDALVPSAIRWTVPERATLALLDDRVLAVIRTWPSVGRLLFERMARRGARLGTLRAIAQLPRVDQRLVAYFGQAAERWGRVTPNGLVIPLHLTHETLGRLIGARRPTVSLALKDLATAGLLERRGDGAWLLRYGALNELASPETGSAQWHPAEARTVAVADPLEEASAPASTLNFDDVAALHERVRRLREEHEARVARCAAAIARSRESREARSGAVRRDAFAPRAVPRPAR